MIQQTLNVGTNPSQNASAISEKSNLSISIYQSCDIREVKCNSREFILRFDGSTIVAVIKNQRSLKGSEKIL